MGVSLESKVIGGRAADEQQGIDSISDVKDSRGKYQARREAMSRERFLSWDGEAGSGREGPGIGRKRMG